MKKARRSSVRLQDSKRVSPEQVRALFRAAGWTEDVARFSTQQVRKLLRHSSFVVTAWNGRRELVGFASAVSDGVLCGMVQNLVVHPRFRRLGVGTRLLRELSRRMNRRGVSCLYALGARTRAARSFFTRVGFQPLRWDVFVRLAR